MNISSYEDYMTGFWTGDPEFCESTGISDMLVWFDTPEGWTTTRSCYLVINPDIANCAFKLRYWRGWGGPNIGPYSIRAECEFPEFADDPPFPENISIDIDTILGQMCIYHDDKIYARLVKSHSITNRISKESDSSDEIV